MRLADLLRAEAFQWLYLLTLPAVLLLRRPVARHFGPQVAYALWALPAARLLIPPVVLPAWMAPQRAALPAPEIAVAAPATDPDFWQIAATAPSADAVAVPAAVLAAPSAPEAGFDLIATIANWPILEVLLTLWLGGAAVFLALRFAAYFSLRDGLLDGAVRKRLKLGPEVASG